MNVRKTAVFGILFVGYLLSASAAGARKHPQKEGSLVWSDEFSGTAAQSAPDPANWTYDTGTNGFGNHELETYCAWDSATPPCDPAHPSAWVGNDGYLHIMARSFGNGVYTSARLKSEGLRSFQYGRIEARIKIPRGQGIWPAFWMIGDDIRTAPWPTSGEFDIMENIGRTPFTVYGSIHGKGFTGDTITRPYSLPDHAAFADGFHVYGMIWTRKKVQYYVDDPANVYASFTPKDVPKGGLWPFNGRKFFFLLNVAVGGDWPGNPDATSTYPQEMLVDYVRVYSLP